MIKKNPMQKVNAPKREEARGCLDTRTSKTILPASFSLPHGFSLPPSSLAHNRYPARECMGLKWRDIDENRCTLNIERNVSYTPESGVIVSTPTFSNCVLSGLNIQINIFNHIICAHCMQSLKTGIDIFPHVAVWKRRHCFRGIRS